ncbi:MAG: selenide, water dikinase SelD, partial [Pseudomonadota bacterium]
METPLPLTRDLVLVGGGHAHALVLRRWGMRPLPGARLTLIDPLVKAPYTGMLPGFVAGHYAREEVEIDLVRLARFAGARLVRGRVAGIDRTARRLLVPGRPPVAYDVASLDIGISAPVPPIEGGEYIAPAKPFGAFAAAFDRFLEEVHAGRAPEAVILGGGVAGAELALAVAHRLRTEAGRAAVTLVERAPEILTEVAPATRQLLARALEAAGIAVRAGQGLSRLDGEAVWIGEARIPAGFVAATTGAGPAPWLAETGLDLTDGFVTVGATLQSSDPAIFAAGDIAHMAESPRVKAGVFAVRQGPVLAESLRRALTGWPPRRFRPQARYLKLISMGDRTAVADKWGFSLSGPWVWRWKDRIDRRFMDRFARLPAMTPPRPAEVASGAAGAEPLCGGCGSKLGQGALTRALSALPPAARADVVTGPGDDAAVLALPGGGRQVITHDHLRAFWDDPYVMARIAALHALGDVWAMGAAPQAMLAAVTLPRMAEGMAEATLAEILAAARQVAEEAGAALVGGHTTQGAEMVLGFTVTGLTERPV